MAKNKTPDENSSSKEKAPSDVITERKGETYITRKI